MSMHKSLMEFNEELWNGNIFEDLDMGDVGDLAADPFEGFEIRNPFEDEEE